jgi:hypothetical protein
MSYHGWVGQRILDIKSHLPAIMIAVVVAVAVGAQLP